MTVTGRGERGAGRGRVSHVAAPPEYRGTTRQVCGLWPWAVGGMTPTIGVPLGHNIRTGRWVGCDPISWFDEAHLIAQPSFVMLGRPALGKSTAVRVIASGLAGLATPLISGDLKGEYCALIEALGGQVITLGRGEGALNVLDTGALDHAATRIGGVGASALREEAHGRRLNIVRALLAIVRGRPTEDSEDIILNAALRYLRKHWRRKLAPVIPDLIRVIRDVRPDELRVVAVDHGSDERYRDATDGLVRSLIALCDGPLGNMFARQTAARLRLDAPGVGIDVSALNDNDPQLQAAALGACWSEVFGTVEANNALADAGLIPQRRFLIIVDEMWQFDRAGHGLDQFVNSLTRLNRDKGVGQILISHSGADMSTGYLERAGAFVCFGLPRRELEALREIVAFTDEEVDLIASWSTPPGWVVDNPPGRGLCVVKVGERPGIPLSVDLVEAEAGLHNTSKRWAA